MKKYITPILLTLIPGFVTIAATAQPWSQKFNIGITYSSLNKQNRYTSVFSLLASNNNKNINDLRLQFSFDMQFSVSKNVDNQTILKYLSHNQKITGDVFFRDFKIDTLLFPQKLVVQWQLYKNGQLADTLNRIISAKRGQLVLPLPGNIPPASLSITMTIKQIVFTQKAYNRFLQTAGLINRLLRLRQNHAGNAPVYTDNLRSKPSAGCQLFF